MVAFLDPGFAAAHRRVLHAPLPPHASRFFKTAQFLQAGEQGPAASTAQARDATTVPSRGVETQPGFDDTVVFARFAVQPPVARLH